MSVQNLYNKYKTGKISKYNFLEAIRKDENLPWITNLNSITEVISILKGKNVIWEDKNVKWHDAHFEGDGGLEEVETAYDDDDELSQPAGAPPVSPESLGGTSDADASGYDPSLAYGHIGNVNEEDDDFSDFSDDFPMSMEYDDDPMDATMIGSPEDEFGFGDDDNPEDQGSFENPEDHFGFKDGGEFDDEGNELPGEVNDNGMTTDDDQSTSGEEEWTDPAGGTHRGDEEDPAAMYREIKVKKTEFDGVNFLSQYYGEDTVQEILDVVDLSAAENAQDVYDLVSTHMQDYEFLEKFEEDFPYDELRENKGIAPGMDGADEYDVPYTFGEITVGKEKNRPNYKKGQNSVQDIVTYVSKNPGKSENEIMQGSFGFDRNNDSTSNKKFADLLRRALSKGLIVRTKKIDTGNTKYFYSLPESDGSVSSPQYQEGEQVSLNEGKGYVCTIDTVNPYEFKRGINWESGLTYSSIPDWGFKFMDQEKYKKLVDKVLANLTKDSTYYSKKLASVKPTNKPDLDSKANFAPKKSKRYDVAVAFKPGEKNLDKREGNIMKTVGKLEKANTKDTLGKKEVGGGTTVKVKTFKAPGSGGKMKKFKALKESLVNHFKKKGLTEIAVSQVSSLQAFLNAIKACNVTYLSEYVKSKTDDELVFKMPGGRYIDNDRFDDLKKHLSGDGYTLSEVDYSDEDHWDFNYVVHKPDVDEAFAQKTPEGETLDITSDPGGAASELTTKAKKLGVQVKSTKL